MRLTSSKAGLDWIGLAWSVAICIHPVDGLRDARKSSAARAESMFGAVLFVAG
jgi:hypothetical protein